MRGQLFGKYLFAQSRQLDGDFPKLRGYLFGGPNKKDCSSWRSILGLPLFWEAAR